MQVLIYLLFCSLFFLMHLGRMDLAPRYVTWAPEIISGLLLVAVVGRAAAQRSLVLDVKYVLVIGVFVVAGLMSAVANSVPSGVVFAGIRNYFKFLPLFFVPAVFHFTERQLENQLKFLLIICLIQLPVAAAQKYYFASQGFYTGDVVTGTLRGSGILTIFLLLAVAVLTGFFAHGRLRLGPYLLVLLALFFPTAINETKVTLFLLPLAIVIPVLVSRTDGSRGRVVVAVVLVALLISIFVPVYDALMAPRRDEGITEFIAKEGRVEGYLERTGRSGQLVYPVRELSEDPIRLFWGLGIGNVSESFLGAAYTGEYFSIYGAYAKTALAQYFWETGIIGVLAISALFLFVFRDSMHLRHGDDTVGALSTGMAGAVLIAFISLYYNKSVLSDDVGYLFWYFSGLIAAEAMRRRTTVWKRAGGVTLTG